MFIQNKLKDGMVFNAELNYIRVISNVSYEKQTKHLNIDAFMFRFHYRYSNDWGEFFTGVLIRIVKNKETARILPNGFC